MTFRTITFNMQNGQPWDEAAPDDSRIDLVRTAEFLSGQEADVIFLQEVERGFDGGNQIDPPPNYNFLRKHLKGYDSVFAYPVANQTEIPFGLGLAIFSKSKLRDFQKTDLPACGGEFEFEGSPRKPSQRLLISAATVIQGREIRLLNTHLQALFMIGSTSAGHPEQRNAVEAELRLQNGPAILAGDLNCTPAEGVVEQFELAGFRTAQNQEMTWRRMPYVLDHLFYNAPLRLESHAVIPTLASDHHAVRADFSFV
ncbi:MAG: endonuclease/exonuclease/phosphatase family protein [Verrucomicrobiota bacterium]|jgi:endonuclease/exonuclease/phosphatase family metal-dependent hydrolase